MCEKCPPPTLADDPLALRLARDLVARCQELLPETSTPDRHAQDLLVYAVTYCRNGLITHMGSASGEAMLSAMAHVSAMEVKVQAEIVQSKSGMTPLILPMIIEGVAGKFAKYLSRSIFELLQSGTPLRSREPGLRKEAS